MVITTETLRAAGACQEGIQAFERVTGGELRGEWTASTQAFALGTELRKFLGWAWNVGLVPQWSMARWDMCHANLHSADLRGAKLYESDLRGADLRGADLRGADFSDANLHSADLRGAKLPDGWREVVAKW